MLLLVCVLCLLLFFRVWCYFLAFVVIYTRLRLVLLFVVWLEIRVFCFLFISTFVFVVVLFLHRVVWVHSLKELDMSL